MKKKIILFSIALTLLNCGQTVNKEGLIEKIEHEYKDGRPEKISFYKEAINENNKTKEILYYIDGKIKAEVSFANGVKHGKYVIWDNNGKIQKEGIYNNDKEVGVVKTYYPSGIQERYLDGDGKDTLEIWYYIGGQINSKIWRNSSSEGKWVAWYENGNKWVDDDVSGNHKAWYPNGKLKEKGQFDKERKRNGIWNYWDENGDPLSDTIWESGVVK